MRNYELGIAKQPIPLPLTRSFRELTLMVVPRWRRRTELVEVGVGGWTFRVQKVIEHAPQTLTPNPSPKGRGEQRFSRIFILILLVSIAFAGCAKHSSPVVTEPAKEPTQRERMLCSTDWFADSMTVNGRTAALFYNDFIRRIDTALTDYNYAGCGFSFLLNYRVWFRSVTTLPWDNYYYPEKALENWTLSDDGVNLTIGFEYARPLQEGVWSILELSRTSLVLSRSAGRDSIIIFCSPGAAAENWTQQQNARLYQILYQTWLLDSCSKHELVLADSLTSIKLSDFSGGAGFADITYKNGSAGRNSAHASMNVSTQDDIPEFGFHMKYATLTDAAYTYFSLVFLGPNRMELIEQATNTRFIFKAAP
jgi:hypothetical protein